MYDKNLQISTIHQFSSKMTLTSGKPNTSIAVEASRKSTSDIGSGSVENKTTISVGQNCSGSTRTLVS